jgi:hypothetical protein
MPLRPSLHWLLLTLGAALLAMIFAAGSVRKTESAIAAGVFALVLIATAVRSQSPLWPRTAPNAEVTPRSALLQTVRLIMLAYLWCGVAFLAIYLGTNVCWQHGWEYGTAMLVIAVGHAYYLSRLADPNDSYSTPAAIEQAIRIASYQAILIGLSLIWLIGSGKLSSLKGDWAANQLFLAGGFAIMCLCGIMIKTNAVLSERSPAR